jgi:hypothetical protein
MKSRGVELAIDPNPKVANVVEDRKSNDRKMTENQNADGGMAPFFCHQFFCLIALVPAAGRSGFVSIRGIRGCSFSSSTTNGSARTAAPTKRP